MEIYLAISPTPAPAFSFFILSIIYIGEDFILYSGV